MAIVKCRPLSFGWTGLARRQGRCSRKSKAVLPTKQAGSPSAPCFWRCRPDARQSLRRIYGLRKQFQYSPPMIVIYGGGLRHCPDVQRRDRQVTCPCRAEVDQICRFGCRPRRGTCRNLHGRSQPQSSRVWEWLPKPPSKMRSRHCWNLRKWPRKSTFGRLARLNPHRMSSCPTTNSLLRTTRWKPWNDTRRSRIPSRCWRSSSV